MADNIYKIKNVGSRPRGFQVAGGIETVRKGQTRTLQLKSELSEEAIAKFKGEGVEINTATKADNPENVPKDDRPPADAGGIEPQSKVDERGGVDRKEGSTTTTTAPTNKQVGPKA